MNKELVESARDCLALRLISLRDAQLKSDPAFDPTVVVELNLQTRFGLKDVQWIDKSDGAGNSSKTVRGLVEAGVRLLFPQGQSDESGPKVAVEFVATYSAEYDVQPNKEVSQDAAKEFLQHNAAFHVWPYWREYVQSTFNRAALPAVTLPMMVIKPTANPGEAKLPSGVGAEK
jgi:hypothetical protein